jgi:hypothetical protein
VTFVPDLVFMTNLQADFDALLARISDQPKSSLSKIESLESRFDVLAAAASPVSSQPLARAECCQKARDAKNQSAPTKISKQYMGLAKGWNRLHGLHEGDRAHALKRKFKHIGAQFRRRRIHKNKWHFSNVVNQGYKAVGKVGVKRAGDIGVTRRTCDVVGGTSGLLLKALSNELKTLMAQHPLGLFIVRGHDATPAQASFGSYGADVMGFARYAVRKEDDSGFKLVKLDAFQALRGKRFAPKFGVVELLATRDEVHCRLRGEKISRVSIHPACVVENTKASTLMTAVEAMNLDLSFAALNVHKHNVKVFMVNEVPDSARSVKRKLKATGPFLPKECLYVADACASHVVHLIIEDSIDEVKLVCDVHAVAFITHVPSHFNRMVAKYRDYLLQFANIKQGAPDAKFAIHTRAVLRRTLRRHDDLVRGRLSYDVEGKPHAEKPSKSQKTNDDRVETLVAAYNGDITNPIPEFYLNWIVEDRAAVADTLTASALHGGLFLGGGDNLPAANRWGSCIEAATALASGIMIHDTTCSTIVLAFPSYENGDVGDEHSDEYRAKCKGKVWRAKCLSLDREKKEKICLTVWLTPPLDHLWRHVQRLDIEGGGIFALARPNTNPYYIAGCAITAQFKDASQFADLEVYFNHFDQGSEAKRNALCENALSMNLSMGAHLYWRLELPSFEEPYKSAGIALPGSEPADRLTLCQEKYEVVRACPLCVDEHCTLKSTKLFEDAQEMHDDPEYLLTMSHFGEHGKLCNMQMERMLATIRQACPGRSPALEMLLEKGYISQILGEHLSSRGDDPRIATRENLIAEGVPLRASKETHKKRRGNDPAFLFANRKVAELRRSHGALTQPARRTAWASYHDAFQDEPAAIQLEFRALAIELSQKIDVAGDADDEVDAVHMKTTEPVGTSRRKEKKPSPALWGLDDKSNPVCMDYYCFLLQLARVIIQKIIPWPKRRM